jgi:endo-1,4-beta-xylanase
MPSLPTSPVAVGPATVSFPDVPPGHPFFAEVTWAAEGGLAQGFDDGRFGPAVGLTRQEVAAFLHRSAGAPAGPFPDPGYPDVPPTHPFADEIAWITSLGLASGFPDGTFRPATTLTRQELVAILYRSTLLAELPGG